MPKFGISERHYKAAIEEAKLKLVLDSKPPAAAKSNNKKNAALDSDSDDNIKRPRSKKAAWALKKNAALDSDSDEENKKPRAKKAAWPPKKIAALMASKKSAPNSTVNTAQASNERAHPTSNENAASASNESYWTCNICTYNKNTRSKYNFCNERR
jgi:hypothetical protein